MDSKEEYQYIGKSEFNVNATAKATGRAKYCSDMELSGMLYGKVKRSPYPHARIISIDTSAAERLPGVKTVIVGDDKTCPFRFGAGITDEHRFVPGGGAQGSREGPQDHEQTALLSIRVGGRRCCGHGGQRGIGLGAPG